MKNPKSIKELMRHSGAQLGTLRARSHQRTLALAHVCAALPPKLAGTVVSAGIEQGRLTVGVGGGIWAVRLRYAADALRLRVSSSMGIDIQIVRIKVVPPFHR